MSKQKIIRTVKEDTEVLERARKCVKIGQVVSFEDKNLKKIKGGWEEIQGNVFANLVIKQV